MQNPIFVSFQHKRQSVRHHNHSRSAIMSFFDRRWSAFRSHDNRDNFLLLVTQLGNCDVQSHSPSQWSLISHHLSSTFATLWPNQFLCFSQLRLFWKICTSVKCLSENLIFNYFFTDSLCTWIAFFTSPNLKEVVLTLEYTLLRGWAWMLPFMCSFKISLQVY